MGKPIVPKAKAKSPRLLRCCAAILLYAVTTHASVAAQQTEIKIGFLHTSLSRTKISLIDVPAANEGLAGARLAIDDNNTTGKFIGQQFSLIEAEFNPSVDTSVVIKSFADQGVSLMVAAIAADDLLRLSDAAKPHGSMMLLNVSALREQQCRANVAHIAPSRAMLADALAQYLACKKWRR